MPYHQCPGCGITSYSAAAYSSASVCPLCSAELSDDSKLFLPFRAGPALSRRLPAGPNAPGEARAAVAGLRLPVETLDTLKLVVSELVTNSVKHAGLSSVDRIELLLATGDEHIWVAVHDEGPGFSPTAQKPDGPGGFGFMVVAAQSETWGVDCERGGCTVWCAIAVEDASNTTVHLPVAEEVPDPVLSVAL